jgi:hypothetical protein
VPEHFGSANVVLIYLMDGPLAVMAGLVPAIYALLLSLQKHDVHVRDICAKTRFAL